MNDQHHIPVHKTWLLNEKLYGSLQGLSKQEITEKHGKEQVKTWRRSLDVAPPPLEESDPRHPAKDKRYSHLPKELIPSSENYGQVVERVRLLIEGEIKPMLMQGKVLLVVGHGSTIRAAASLISGKAREELAGFNIPNATPVVINLKADLSFQEMYLLGNVEEIEEKMRKIES